MRIHEHPLLPRLAYPSPEGIAPWRRILHWQRLPVYIRADKWKSTFPRGTARARVKCHAAGEREKNGQNVRVRFSQRSSGIFSEASRLETFALNPKIRIIDVCACKFRKKYKKI